MILKMFNFLKKKQKRKGVSIPELMLIVALVSLVLIVVFGNLGDTIKETVSTMTKRLAQSNAYSQQMASEN